jgi:tripartite-type tricarboxylate transporter receptor subunit TctC
MKLSFLKVLFGAATIFVLSGLTAGYSWSQVPRNIRFIVPFPPGGPASILARLLGDHIERTQNVTVVIETRPGGGGVIGTEAVARAAPDGATLLIHNPSIILNSYFRKQNYDPVKGFEPICKLVDVPMFIAVSGASPYQTLADLIDAARASPGKLTLAALAATPSHIGFSLIKRRANVDITFVPFPGTAPMINALLGGHISSMSDNYAGMAEHANAGTLRPLVTYSNERVVGLNNIPTIAESGYPDIKMSSWFGLFAPANLKKEAASQLIEWTLAGLQAPGFMEKITPLGLYPSKKTCGAEFIASFSKEYEAFGIAIHEANIQSE